MPSLQQWENIRDEFCTLYITRDLTLSQTRAILALRGFHATTKQYKNQITEWQLRKNNKHSDMAFALRKMSQRELAGKDTVFEIQGQVKSRQDILHYWKRTKTQPTSLPTSPGTPPGLLYATPEPISQEDHMDFTTSGPESGSSLGVQNSNGTTLATQSSQSVPMSLALPDLHRETEMVLWNIRQYNFLCALHNSTTTPAQKELSARRSKRFSTCLSTITYCELYDTAPFCAEQARQECLLLAPLIMQLRDLKPLLGMIVWLVSCLNLRPSGYGRSALWLLAQHIAEMGASEFPLAYIMRLIAKSPSHAIPLFKAVMYLSHDCSVREYGNKSYITKNSTQYLLCLNNLTGNWSETLRLAELEQQEYLHRPSDELSEDDRLSFLQTMATLAWSQMKLGDIEKAFNTIEEAVLLCRCSSFYHEDGTRILCDLLITRGDMLAHFDRRRAVEAYEDVLDHARDALPPDDGVVLAAAGRLSRHISNLGDHASQSPRQA